jgi:general secretion pathway protein I
MRRVASHRQLAASRGFTLLEVMLAFVVFALSFAVVLEIMAGSVAGIRRASDDTQVALLAQSLMDRVGLEFPLEESQYDGEEMDRFRWQLDIFYHDPGAEGAYTLELAELSGVVLYQVTLDIEWEAGRQFRHAHFSTVRSMVAAP